MIAGEQERKRRCHLLNKLGNRCQNEELNEYGLCLGHLREAAAEWARVVGEVVEKFPALGAVIGQGLQECRASGSVANT